MPRNLEIPFFVTLLSVVSIILVWMFLPYLNAIVLGAVFAVLFHPLHNKLVNLFKGEKGLAAGITTFLVCITVFIPLSFFAVIIFTEARHLYNTYFDPSLAGTLDLNSVFPGLDQYVRKALEWLIQHLGDIFASVSSVIVSFLLSLFCLFYLLRDGDKLKKAVIYVTPLAQDDTEEILSRLHLAVTTTLRGTIIIALVQGFVASIGLFIFQAPLPALWGLATTFASMIPMVGTSLVMLPMVIYLLLFQNSWNTLGLFLWWVFGVSLIDNLLMPMLIKKGVQVHKFLILLGVIGGIGLFGPMGFLIGPLLLSLLAALLSIYPKIILKRDGDSHP